MLSRNGITLMYGNLALSTRLQIPDGIARRDLEGELVLLNLNSGIYFGLDPVGTRIWHLLETGQTLSQVLSLLLEEYDVTEAQGRQDLERFITQMREKGLIAIAHETVS